MLERTGQRRGADDADGMALRDHAMLELLYAGGLRVGEIVALRQEDLRLETASVQVRGKGDKERIVPIGAVGCGGAGAYVLRGRPGLVRPRVAAGFVFVGAGECADDAGGLADGAGGESSCESA